MHLLRGRRSTKPIINHLEQRQKQQDQCRHHNRTGIGTSEENREFSIADIACFPWVAGYERLGANLDAFAHLRRWFDAIKVRPAVRRGMDLGDDWRDSSALSNEEARKVLFGQTAESIAEARQGAK